MRAANVDMDHEPVPGFGAAMTLEQYRAMAAGKAYMKGTLHATPKEEKAEMDDKDELKRALERKLSLRVRYRAPSHL